MKDQVKLSVHNAIIQAAHLKLQHECANIETPTLIDLKKYALDIVDAIEAADNHEYLKQPISNP